MNDRTDNLDTRSRSFRRDGRAERITGERFRSLRAYRRQMDDLIRQAIAGKMSWSNCRAASAALKVAAETFMAETLLGRAGGDVEVEKHPLGADGGLEAFAALQPHRTKKVTVRRGVDKLGNPVDEKKVEIDSTDADDPGLEAEAEGEVLV